MKLIVSDLLIQTHNNTKETKNQGQYNTNYRQLITVY